MKANGNYEKQGSYYLGLDVGTNSVGWAVTNHDYNILKFKGKAMWGVRLFEEAKDASERRSSRAARRRLARRKQRLELLQMLFAEEIAKVDKSFFARMRESAIWPEDKEVPFALFADRDYTDREYHKQYPTVYHLRSELIHSDKPHDVRLVYLAVHHILKCRGHFLYDTGDASDQIVTLDTAFSDLREMAAEVYGAELSIPDEQEYLRLLQRRDLGVTAKKRALRSLTDASREDDELDLLALSDMLAGATVKFSDLFRDESLKNADIKSISLSKNLDEQFDELSMILGERVELLLQMKTVFDAARLTQILGEHSYFSEAKVALYEKNRRDLRLLKAYVREFVPAKYKEIFTQRKKGLNNYAAYSRYSSADGAVACSQEDFCKYLKGVLVEPRSGDTDMTRIWQEIQDGTFLTRLRGTDNGVVPYQLQKRELQKILDNASKYLPFLNRVEDGVSVSDKILQLFQFRVPYYVGPLNSASPNSWAVRYEGKEREKIFPWNFEQIVDTEQSAVRFIDNLIGKCTYTGEKVLPKDSLLYSEFMLLNEINLLRVNGHSLPQTVKHEMLRALFYNSGRKVTKKKLESYLFSVGAMQRGDELSGIDDSIKTTLRSYHDLRGILERTGDYDLAEQIIRGVLVFGEDKAMLRRWLKKTAPDLSEAELRHVCRLKYSDWGRLSEFFLTGITSPDETGAEKTVMDLLRTTDKNLMQLLSSDYSFAEKAEQHRAELMGGSMTLSEKLDELYIAPAVRRGIRQTLRIADEIVDAMGCVPEKIFIEMARGSREEMKGKRTESRKNQLLALYKQCGEESSGLFKKLENEDDNSLRRDKLYLYYVQLGKCMYTGEPIDLDKLLRGEEYDIDHIFPQSRVKDNSIDNRVLVKNIKNREKTNEYPIREEIRTRMQPVWAALRQAKLISEKKYDRLVRSTPLTEQELSAFVARQLTETQQSTKALTVMLKELFGDRSRIVFSKAGNVSDFRHDFDMIKCREVNDLHHAKDAYLNVVVGNVYCTRFTDRFFANIRSENYSLNRVFDFDTPGAWDKDETIKTVKRQMAKNNVLVTRMPYEAKGKLFNKLTIMPAGKAKYNKKQQLDKDKYGGYTEIAGSHFCLVEIPKRNKKVRVIAPVLSYAKESFCKDPVLYCETVLGMESPKVIIPCIRKDALLELDGFRVTISGRTGNYILVQPASQLILDYEKEKYVKALRKYADRCAARREVLPITDYDGITEEQNADLYNVLCGKCKTTAYKKILESLNRDLAKGKERFLEQSIYDQVQLLLEILKAFKCDSQMPRIKILNGKNEPEKLRWTRNITEYSTAFLIHQSVTGLYEYRTDLLQ